jgi:glutathione S-transferase
MIIQHDMMTLFSRPCIADAAVKDAAAVEANNVLLVGLLDDAEAQLAKSAFLAGPAYSVADVMFTPVLFRCVAVSSSSCYLFSHSTTIYHRPRAPQGMLE